MIIQLVLWNLTYVAIGIHFSKDEKMTCHVDAASIVFEN